MSEEYASNIKCKEGFWGEKIVRGDRREIKDVLGKEGTKG